MKTSKMSPVIINARRKRLARILELGTRESRTAITASPENEGRVIIFHSELDYLSKCIMDYPDIETGGQLFGYWTEDGAPVVMYAIGPGPKANHQITFFNQDVDYLVAIGRLIKERYGLHHIGEWHSHHRLGLAKPSGHDAHTMNSTIREKGLGRFLLCIGNLDCHGPTVGAFLCDGERCSRAGWRIIPVTSPLRRLADREFQEVLSHPRSYLQAHEDRTGTIPTYAPGYWLWDKKNAPVLEDIVNMVKRYHGLNEDSVRVLLNDKGEVLLRVEILDEVQREILFPAGFPWVEPQTRNLVRGDPDRIVPIFSLSGWRPMKGILTAFNHYYNNLMEEQ